MHSYSEVPKGFKANCEYRGQILSAAEKDPKLQADLLESCKKDILFYFNTFVWTFDPRLNNSTVPFITYVDFQDEVILEIQEAIERGKKYLLQKSRDMGASWMCLGVFDYLAQFRLGKKFLMMSRNADLVDKPDEADSLFWKVDFIHNRLPTWMLDPGKGGNLARTKMRASYLKTGSTLTGATTTKATGIGGRATAVFVDEFSRFDPQVARMIKAGLPDVSNCVTWNFTPSPEMGTAHPSYEVVEQYREGIINGTIMHWRKHPEKAKGLYRVDRQTRKMELLDKKAYNIRQVGKKGGRSGYEIADKPTGDIFPTTYDFEGMDAYDGEFEWHSIWFDKERRERGNDRDIREMLEIDYEGSGFGVFDERLIKEYIGTVCKQPMVEAELVYDVHTGKPDKLAKTKGGRIKLWTQIDGNGKLPMVQYGAGADISLGVGATPSCLSIARVDTGEKLLQVAVADMDPKEFACLVVAICRWLSSPGRDVLLCWERNGPGDTFGAEVIRLGYTAVYMPEDKQMFGGKQAKKPGWPPAPKNLRMLLTAYKSALSTMGFTNYSFESMEECFQWTNTPTGPKHKKTLNKSDDPSTGRENHGDRVIGDALCNMMVEYRGGGTTKKEVKKSQEPKDAHDWYMAMMGSEEKDPNNMYADWAHQR